MKYTDVEPGLEDEVPWSDSLTAYDKEHFKTYLRFWTPPPTMPVMRRWRRSSSASIRRKSGCARAKQREAISIGRTGWMTTGYKELFA